jgi:hypothetical protein
MMQYLFKMDPKKALRTVLLAQIAMAGSLVAMDAFGNIATRLPNRVEHPAAPVSPGDQRRHYRTDRPDPALVILEDEPELPLPQEFSSRLTFSNITVQGIGNVLLLSGQIENGDASRLDSFLSETEKMPDVVALHSPGGLVFEALRIGRTLRGRGLKTAVLSGAFCMSSCPYILAGGVERIVSLNAIVGMHQHYYEQPKYIPAVFAVEDIQTGQGATMEYLIEMGIDPSLMLYSLKTPPEEIYALVESELVETRIATKIIKFNSGDS